MTTEPTEPERAAVAAARVLIAARRAEGRHHVAATVVAADGTAHTALNLECTLGRAAICAEAVAIGMARLAGPVEIAFSVAVNRRGEVLPPCGSCRELLLDYGPEARIAVPASGDWAVRQLAALLPVPYKEGRRGPPEGAS